MTRTVTIMRFGWFLAFIGAGLLLLLAGAASAACIKEYTRAFNEETAAFLASVAPGIDSALRLSVDRPLWGRS